MVLPIGDAPNPRGVAVVNYLLIAANVAVYALIAVPLSGVRPDPRDPLLLEYVRTMSQALGDRVSAAQLLQQTTAYDLYVYVHGFRAAAPSIVDLFTSMFLHGGFLHLAGNMLFLWIYGDNVEHRMGSLRYLIAYLATGVAATAFQMVGDPRSPIPMVGASGAISGVLGFYFIWFPHNTVRLLWLFPPFVMQVFEVGARLVLGLYLIADNLLPYLLTRETGGVAHGAHIGGFVAGLAAAWLLDRRMVARRPTEYAHEAARGDGEDTIGAMIDSGRMEEAAEAYFALPTRATRGALAAEQSLRLAKWLADHGHAQAALIAARRHIRDFPRGPGLDVAHVLAGQILLDELQQPTAAYQHFLDALEHNPSPQVASAARHGLGAIDALQKRQIGRLHSPHSSY